MKKQILVPILIILIVAGMLLCMSFGLNKFAAANAQAEHQKIMETILPGSTEFTVEPYAGDDANIRSVHKGETGFVVETVTYGYAGDITMLIHINIMHCHHIKIILFSQLQRIYYAFITLVIAIY